LPAPGGLPLGRDQLLMVIGLGIQAGLQADQFAGAQGLADEPGKPLPLLLAGLRRVARDGRVRRRRFLLGLGETPLARHDLIEGFFFALPPQAKQPGKVAALHRASSRN
jgi:hypothetical protein